MIPPSYGHLAVIVLLFTLSSGFSIAAVPSFWSIPMMLLSDTAAAAFFGLITAYAQIGGFIGPSLVGYFNDKTHSLQFSLAFISASMLCSTLCLSFIRLQAPAPGQEGQSESSARATAY
jgi:ACS family tartrate transporter-like MFS transporter